jgi:hypothetical protein
VNDRPSAEELLRAVRRFLNDQVVPALSGPARYHARVAANVVAIVAREIETEESHLRGEWQRLGQLLTLAGEPAPDRDALRAGVTERSRELARRIRTGDADSGPWRDQVMAHLCCTVDDKLDVARPPRED